MRKHLLLFNVLKMERDGLLIAQVILSVVLLLQKAICNKRNPKKKKEIRAQQIYSSHMQKTISQELAFAAYPIPCVVSSSYINIARLSEFD